MQNRSAVMGVLFISLSFLVPALRTQAAVTLPLALDFNAPSSPTAPGYIGFPVQVYNSTLGYGWQSTYDMDSRSRNSSDALYRDFHELDTTTQATFLVDVPNGTYDVTLYFGDAEYSNPATISISAEGLPATTVSALAAGQFVSRTFTTTVNDGQLTLLIQNPSTGLLANGLNVVASGPSDTQAPAVTLTAPADGAVVSGASTLSATATDNVGVSGVQFKLDGVNLGTEDTVSPYALSWNTTLVSNGSHTLTAVARDAAGNTTASSPVSVTVANVSDTQAPSVPTSLAATAVSASEIDLSWAASTDDVGVAGYKIYRDGLQIATSTLTSFSNTGLTASTTYSYTVSAYDAVGNNSVQSSSASATTNILSSGPVYPLKPSANNRYLVDQNNTPFLIVGDSPHGMISDLSLSEANTFLATRKSQGYNTMYVQLLWNYNSTNAATYDGIVPFTTTNDLSTPNEAYFARADAMINLAAQYGINVNLDPIKTGGFIEVLRANGTAKARAFGQYLGNRYKNFDNIVWSSGDDFYTWSDSADDALVQAVALGIKDFDTRHIHTIELGSSEDSLQDARWAPVIQLDSVYDYCAPAYMGVLNGYNRPNFMPVFFGEGAYEEENNCGQSGTYGTPSVVRSENLWTDLAGGTGALYGHRVIWNFLPGWQSYLSSPGAVQSGYLSNLFANRHWYDLIPDQNHTVTTAGYGTYGSGNKGTNDYVTTSRTPDGSLVMAYVPTSRTITVNMTKLSGPATAQWYDPTNNTYTSIAGSPLANSGSLNFTTPSAPHSDGATDWVLVLEALGGVPPQDTQAPSVPTNLTASSIGQNSINLSWATSTDNIAVAGYKLFRDGVWVSTTTNPSNTSYLDRGLNASTTYTYTVSAYDAAGNSSDLSGPVSATTLPFSDITPPSTPTGLSATVVAPTQINLSWSASVDNIGVTAYKIYRCSGSTCAPTVQIGTTTAPSRTYQNTGLTGLTTYRYRIIAVDAAGNASGFSSIVSATTPETTLPTVTITSPANGASVSASITVRASASDNVGVAGVQFKLDGVNLGAEDTTSTYTASWNTRNSSNGSHTLTAVARDAAGNTKTSATVTVTVSN